ncbi:hypothetical protein VXQ18_05685 [Brucella abortus]|nr:hypothetical protein [Brucella abortus]
MKETLYEGVNQGDKDFSAAHFQDESCGHHCRLLGRYAPGSWPSDSPDGRSGAESQFISGDGIVSNELASVAGDAVAGVMNNFRSRSARRQGQCRTHQGVP